MGNYKSFVFNSTSEVESLVTPAIGRYHLYINTNGIIKVIDHEGNIISQGSNGLSSIGTDDVADQSDIAGGTLTQTLNSILDVVNNLGSAPVSSVNGQIGAVTIGVDDIALEDFFVLNINNDIVNGVYRRNSEISPPTYYRVDAGSSGSGDSISVQTILSVGNVWTIHKNFGQAYSATDSGFSTPADVTEWTITGDITPVPSSFSTIYSGNSQTSLEKVAQKAEDNSMLVYDGSFINSHLEAIYNTTTSSGSWTVYPTDDASNTGDPMFSSILFAIPSITHSSAAVATMSASSVNSISGTAITVAGGAVANGTSITVLIKGIRA